MIPIERIPAPRAIETVRVRKKPALLAAGYSRNHPPSRAELSGYRVAKRPRWEHQRQKCAYCDRVVALGNHPVEHFRPALGGYFWLAWDWDNLLFSCVSCNGPKSNEFPLLDGNSLPIGDSPPGNERPVLINPYAEDPLAHIRFEEVHGRWIPTGDSRGREVIRILNLDQHVERYRVWVRDTLLPDIQRVQDALGRGDGRRAAKEWEQLLRRWYNEEQELRCLTLCVLRSHFPDDVRRKNGFVLTPPKTPRRPMSAHEQQEQALLNELQPAVRDTVYRLGRRASAAMWDQALQELLSVRAWSIDELGILCDSSNSTAKKHVRRQVQNGTAQLDGNMVRRA